MFSLGYHINSGSEKMAFLTEREKQIICLVREGKTAKEIARTLSLGHRTVEKYSLKLRKKLRAKNMPHALSIAAEQGMIEDIFIEVS
jgi:DNA-binding CsgD family transcriptional regulator